MLKRIVFNILGTICLVIGIINRFIPGMPTTPFLILSSMLFAKVNPRMQAWLLRSRLVGPYLDNYLNKRGLTFSYKLRTCAFMWAGMIFSVTLIPLLPIQILVPSIGVLVSIHIFKAKKRAPIKEQSGLFYNFITLVMCWVWLGLGFIFANEFFDYALLGIAGGALSLIIIIYAFVTKNYGGALNE